MYLEVCKLESNKKRIEQIDENHGKINKAYEKHRWTPRTQLMKPMEESIKYIKKAMNTIEKIDK